MNLSTSHALEPGVMERGVAEQPVPILEVRSLHKSFGSFAALRGVCFAVAPQELVFIIGPSGSGKSTLLRCLDRLEHVTEIGR